MTTYTRIVLGAAALAMAGCATIARHETGEAPHFESPKAAADALIKACKDQDTTLLVMLFGQQYRDLVSTGDAADDKARCDRLVKASGEMMRLDPWGEKAVLVVGRDDFPMAVPIVKDAKGWYFDGAAGIEEMHRRRVGGDEISAIGTCRSWASDGRTPPETWRGYRFRVVAPAKRGGKAALVAYPVDYRKSGIMTFIVRPKGDVYERDLGPETAATAAAMTAVDPTGWSTVAD
jgi:hypothetical protein